MKVLTVLLVNFNVLPTEHVRRYIDDATNKELGGESFSILNVPVQINFGNCTPNLFQVNALISRVV